MALLGEDYAMGALGGPGASGGMGSDSIGGVPGIGGYARRYGGYNGPGRVPGGWGGGLLGAVGGFSAPVRPMLPPAAGATVPPGAPGAIPNSPPGAAGWLGGNIPNSPEALTPMLQALIRQQLVRMLQQGGPKRPNPGAPPLGQPQQATPAPFGQPAMFGGQGPPGGGTPNLRVNSPGP
jgi:hypothetical protein